MPTRDKVWLHVRTTGARGVGWVPVGMRQTLPSKARYAVEVHVDQPAQVYLYRRAGRSTLKALWPQGNETSQPTQPGVPLHIPEQGLLPLPAGAGCEELVLVASLRGLSAGQAAKEAAAAMVADIQEYLEVRLREPPPELDPRNRPGFDPVERALFNVFDQGGVSRLRFQFYYK